jgi:hypothetical protein
MKMTPDLLAILYKLPGFPATGKELVRVAGLAATAKLISAWPGAEWRAPSIVGGGTEKGARRYAQLSEVVGIDAAASIVRAWPGGILYIPKCDAVKGRLLEDWIKKEYDKLTRPPLDYSHREAVFELGIKYGKSGRSIERIVNRPDTTSAAAQLGLF